MSAPRSNISSTDFENWKLASAVPIQPVVSERILRDSILTTCAKEIDEVNNSKKTIGLNSASVNFYERNLALYANIYNKQSLNLRGKIILIVAGNSMSN